MAKNSKDNVKVSFVGENAHDVTGSCILIEYRNKKILLECGLYQSNNMKEDYKTNTKPFKFKAREIDYVFINHSHIDHMGLVPRLYKEGCKADIVCTHSTLLFMEPLLEDSCFIIKRDAETLSRTCDKIVEPIYEPGDVEKALSRAKGYDFDRLYQLDETVSFKFIPAGHIRGSAQLILYIKKESGQVKKILYTSDLGNTKIKKPYVEEFVQENKANIVIAESTYSDKSRTVTKKDRDKDLEKIRTVVDTTCFDRKGRVLIPSFAMDRTQYLLTILYDMFGKDETFDIPVIIDSPLACKITKVYLEALEGEDKEKLKEILEWENLRLITDKDESKACVSDKSPKIVLSSSGMLTAGRSIHYVKEFLPDNRATILFCGYAANNSLASKIKNGSIQKTISIDKKPYANRASIVDLKSFSSHIQHDDMINYYKSINCEALYLVHGNLNSKIEFAEELKEIFAKQGKTTKVVCTNKGTSSNI